MDDNTQMKELNTAWVKKEIDFRRQQVNGSIKSASFDGLVYLILSKGLYCILTWTLESLYIFVITDEALCLILSSDLEICNSFTLDDRLESSVHVFTKTRGLVQGGKNGQILITRFDNWKPKSSIEASSPFRNMITALSTRGDLIMAGTVGGEVGGWSYDGSKLYHILEPLNDFVHSISIRETRILVGTENVNEYQLPARKSESDPSIIQQLERLSQKRAKVSLWATYDSEGQKVKWRQEGKLAPYRPMLPMSTGSCEVRLLARKELNDDQQVVVKNFNSGEEFRRFSVDQGIIDFMWCDRDRLFMIYRGRKEILMMDFAKDILGFNRDTTNELAECFSLSYPGGP